MLLSSASFVKCEDKCLIYGLIFRILRFIWELHEKANFRKVSPEKAADETNRLTRQFPRFCSELQNMLKR